MARTGWQRNWIRILTTLLTAAVMVMIFCFSTENAAESDQRSGVFSMLIIRMIHPDFDRMYAETQKEIYDAVQHAVRKCAHFSEYLMLGFFMRLCLESWFGRKKRRPGRLMISAFGAGTVYACTDEAHQLLIEGRAGVWTDVLVDAAGVLTGVVLAAFLIRLIHRTIEDRQL